jgi:NAD-dependent protein deacetylase/lipoamidase
MELAELIRGRQPCVVLTGAGVSTESGIPDFRSPTGLWAQYDPMEYATIGAFRRDPVKVWEFYALRFDVLTRAEPNAGHRGLAELERRGLVRTVITQNVDGLHTRAGSRDVIEVHGSIRTASCLACGTRVSFAEVLASLPVPPDSRSAGSGVSAPTNGFIGVAGQARDSFEEAPQAVPRCPECGEVLKPDVVMFGELLPTGAIERAEALAAQAGLLLVVGSALEVYPVAGLPELTLAAGGALAIVNRGPTGYDGRADVRIDGGAGETLAAVVAALGS